MTREAVSAGGVPGAGDVSVENVIVPRGPPARRPLTRFPSIGTAEVLSLSPR